MELVVIRHGETQANAEGRYLGALDVGLERQAIVALKARLTIVPATPFYNNCGPVFWPDRGRYPPGAPFFPPYLADSGLR